MIQKILTKAEADELFFQNALLIGLSDGVLVSRAAELFGGSAVDFVHRLSRGGEYVTPVPLDVGYCEALTLDGFCYAVAHRNLQLVQEKKNAAPVLQHQDGKETQQDH